MSKKSKTKEAKKMTVGMTERVEERKFLKRWLGKMVYDQNDQSICSLVTAVDLLKGEILVGGSWQKPDQYKRIKSMRKKHWKRRTQFVNN
jgi:hypothetical protein